MTADLHNVTAGEATATTLITIRVALHRSLGETRRRQRERYDEALAAAAAEHGVTADMLENAVDGVVTADLVYFDTLLRRGRPAEAAPVRQGWIDTLADLLER